METTATPQLGGGQLRVILRPNRMLYGCAFIGLVSLHELTFCAASSLMEFCAVLRETLCLAEACSTTTNSVNPAHSSFNNRHGSICSPFAIRPILSIDTLVSERSMELR